MDKAETVLTHPQFLQAAGVFFHDQLAAGLAQVPQEPFAHLTAAYHIADGRAG